MLSLRTADAFLDVASLPPLFFGGREATTGNASASAVLVDGGLGRVRTVCREKKEIKIVNKQAATVESLIDGHRVKNVIS